MSVRSLSKARRVTQTWVVDSGVGWGEAGEVDLGGGL